MSQVCIDEYVPACLNMYMYVCFMKIHMNVRIIYHMYVCVCVLIIEYVRVYDQVYVY